MPGSNKKKDKAKKKKSKKASPEDEAPAQAAPANGPAETEEAAPAEPEIAAAEGEGSDAEEAKIKKKKKKKSKEKESSKEPEEEGGDKQEVEQPEQQTTESKEEGKEGAEKKGKQKDRAGGEGQHKGKLTKAEKRALKKAAGGGEDEEAPVKGIVFDAKAAADYKGAMLCPDPDFNPADNNCRMYESQYPAQEDLVLVRVKTVAEMGAYVELLEYNRIEGMILLSELSRRRIRSINKLIRVGRTEAVVVLRVDTEKGYIDLSKRRVGQADIQRCEDQFKRSKKVHSILTHVSQTCQIPLIKLYQAIGWPLYKKYGHAYEAFKQIVENPDDVLGQFDLHPHVRASLLRNIEFRMTPKAVKIRADLEITCFVPAGITAIKEALRAALAKSTEEMPVSVKLVAPPLFVMLTSSMDQEAGVALLDQAVEACRESIAKAGGDCNVKQAPRAVTERDERILKEVMDELEKQNMEVSGDAAEAEDL